MRKKGPYILITILIILLVFVLGVRYGQRVERTNKIINYLISLPPSPTAEPSQKPVEFQTYSNKVCGIQFLYPNSWLSSQSTPEARFTDKNGTTILIGCEQPNPIDIKLGDEKIATEEVNFKNKTMTFKIQDAGSRTYYMFKFINPKNSKSIFVDVDKSFYPLFEKSLEFLP